RTTAGARQTGRRLLQPHRGNWARKPAQAKGRLVMPIEFSVSDIIPASPQQIYDAWLDSEGHAQITGGQPANISAKEGTEFSAWNGYIRGRTLKLEPGRR